jgi:hypothetical protein
MGGELGHADTVVAGFLGERAWLAAEEVLADDVDEAAGIGRAGERVRALHELDAPTIIGATNSPVLTPATSGLRLRKPRRAKATSVSGVFIAVAEVVLVAMEPWVLPAVTSNGFRRTVLFVAALVGAGAGD